MGTFGKTHSTFIFIQQKLKTQCFHNANLKKQANNISLLVRLLETKQRCSNGGETPGGGGGGESFRIKVGEMFMFFKRLNDIGRQ